jgi:hypothetical protein
MTELQLIRQKIRNKMNELADDLALGSAKDFAEYRYLTGVISGLALVERDVIDLEERQNRED